MEQPPEAGPPADESVEAPAENAGDGGPGSGPSDFEPPVSESPVPETKPRSFLKELPVLILVAFGLALLIKTFFVQAFFIPSGSMLPTLEVQDRVLVNKLVYRMREPRRGEIAVFIAEKDREPKAFWQRVRSFLTEGLGVVTPKEKDFIKRVIGLPGETIEVDAKGRVFITPAGGRRFRLDEPYVSEEVDPTPFGPAVVPDGSFFVMGDNRPNSSDSRKQLGPVRKEDLIGKAFVRIWPLGRVGFFRRPAYESEASPWAQRAPPSRAHVA